MRPVSADHTRDAHLRAVTDGPYGRCAWKCENGVTVTFTMTAFTQAGGRKIRVHGPEGRGDERVMFAAE